MNPALHAAKAVYDRFAEGDLDGFLMLCDDEVEWVVNGPAQLEKCRSFRGRDGVRAFLDLLGRTWSFHAFQARTFITDGDTVVVLGEEAGEDRSTKQPFRNRWVHVFDVQQGKIVRFREFLCHWTGEEVPPPMSWGPHAEREDRPRGS